MSCVVGCAAGGEAPEYNTSNVMGGLGWVASCAGLLVQQVVLWRRLVRFPNRNECPVTSGLGNLTSRRPDWWVVSHTGLALVGSIL